MPALRHALLGLSLALGGCAGNLGAVATMEPARASPLPFAATQPGAKPDPQAERPQPPLGPKPKPTGKHRRDPRDQPNWRFVGWHYGAGVASTLVVQTMTYGVARRIGQTGQGLGSPLGALIVGAFAPPLLNYTFQWALGRTVAPKRDRFWPGFLVRQVVHLGVFAGALLGGADLNNPSQTAALIIGEAFVTSGLATMTAELSRRPQFGPPATTASPARPAAFEFVVPVLELQF
ncbi:hypothetical protein DB30_05884 [Enhygromyxa salina]|uniref:Uncharacterized protein n=1 Tax=Enhygromyxa salina TaxID=215803 RepID=A0A0C1ZBT6_9BACT|nr:hypothetical protein DB30_05884 [Enhygromyxa salina]